MVVILSGFGYTAGMRSFDRYPGATRLLASIAAQGDLSSLTTASERYGNTLSLSEESVRALASIGKPQIRIPDELIACLLKQSPPPDTWVLNEPNWSDASEALSSNDTHYPALTCEDAWQAIITLGRPLSDMRMVLRTSVLNELRNHISFGFRQDLTDVREGVEPEKARLARAILAFEKIASADFSEMPELITNSAVRRAVYKEIDDETDMMITGNWERFIYFMAFIAEKKSNSDLTWEAMLHRSGTDVHHYGIQALNFWEAKRTKDLFEAFPSSDTRDIRVLIDTNYARRISSKSNMFTRSQAELDSMLSIMRHLNMTNDDLMKMPYNEYLVLLERNKLQQSIVANRAETTWNKGAYI